MEADLKSEALDAEDKVDKAEVVAVEVDKEDFMEMKGSILALIFSFYQTISTQTILHLMTPNVIMNSLRKKKSIMTLQNLWDQNRHLNNMNRGGDYQQQQHQGTGKYNQYDDNSSVGDLSVRQLYATNKLPILPRVPALAPPGNENLSGHSDSVDREQCITCSTSSRKF